MGVAFLCAWKAFEIDMRRRELFKPRSELIILLLAISGVLGSRLYHELETPANLLANPLKIFNITQGHAWFGGFLGGIAILSFLARMYKLPILTMMDVASPAAALGYSIGRIGCLLSGDGCYGAQTTLPWGMRFPNGLVPTNDLVHPTPIYEAAIGLFIFLYLRRLWSHLRPPGFVFAQYLILTGASRFFVEFIRLNPRHFFGMTIAQIVSLLCLSLGGLLFARMSLPRPTPDSGA